MGEIKEKETMNIALIYSPNWAEYIKVQAYSIFKNNLAPIKLYLISDEGGEFDTTYITDHFGEGYTIEFINAFESFKKKITTNMNVSTRFTKYALYRLLLPELISDDKLLHIDADTIVSGDLRELYDMDMGNSYITGAIDIHADHYNLKKPLGLKEKDSYVNAGVLLMNLSQIRQDKLQDKWIREANTTRYSAHDQCILNKTCKGKINLMNNKFNVSISTGLNVLKSEIVVMHYAGGDKPFTGNNNVPYPEFWFRTQREYRGLFGGDK